MATKSILKTIDIRDKKNARKFILAMENAEGKTAKTVVVDKKVRTATKEDIGKLFKGDGE